MALLKYLVGENVRAHRNISGLSLQSLSTEISTLGSSVSERQLRRIEHGDLNTINMEHLILIAAALDIPLNWLFRERPDIQQVRIGQRNIDASLIRSQLYDRINRDHSDRLREALKG